ncbi:MAG: WXG100 family type VII secretion target [Aeriscardovia sp.]|nr:WXG100 family type VII secretion target [Aeriscardovia sp.]MBR3461584.1 WXG100 family type VII secretion target [Clostridiales bacterium]
MAATNVRVSSSDLRELSKKFSTLSQELGSTYKSISDNTTLLEQQWSGEASQAFATNIKSTYTTFQKAVEYLDSVSKALTQTANNYDEVERVNASMTTS